MRWLVVALALALFGCAPRIEYAAHVVGKEYRPAHLTFIAVPRSTGKSTYTTLMPVHVPDRYCIFVEKDEPDTSRYTWYGWRRAEPKVYHKIESFLTDPISYSQYQIGTPVQITR